MPMFRLARSILIGRHFCIRKLFSCNICFDVPCDFISTYYGVLSFLRLSSNSDIANRIAADVVTKHESVTLEEIFSYIKQKDSKVQELFCFLYPFPCVWIHISEDPYIEQTIHISEDPP